MTAEEQISPVPTPSEVEAPTAEATPEAQDVQRLLPESTRLELSDGTEVDVLPLKTRQFFRLLKIVTRGGAPILRSMPLSLDAGAAEFTQQLLAVVIMAVPEAEQQAVEFIQSMVEPVGLTGDAEIDLAKRRALHNSLYNPELDDTLAIIEKVISIEGEDIRKLGNRLARMFALAEKTGQTKIATDQQPQPGEEVVQPV